MSIVANNHSNLVYHSVPRAMKPCSDDALTSDAGNGVKAVVDGLASLGGKMSKVPMIDLWLKLVYWAPFLKAAYLFQRYTTCDNSDLSVSDGVYLKFYPVLLCVRRNLLDIFTTWITSLCTLQLCPYIATKTELGLSDFYCLFLNLFDTAVITDVEAFRNKIKGCKFFTFPTGHPLKLHHVLFGNNRFANAFESASRQMEVYNSKNSMTRDDFVRRMDTNSFDNSLPLLAYFLRALSESECVDFKNKEIILKDHSKFLREMERCTVLITNASVQAKDHVRVRRLSEVKAIGSLLAGELSRLISTDDMKLLIKDNFAGQLRVIFDIQSRMGEKDGEKMTIVRYFPLYIRAVSSTAFSTKVTEWRCILYGLCIQVIFF
jgi:hypothetical protein